MVSVLAERWCLLNSLGEIVVSLKLTAKLPLTSVWSEFHPLALKCSVLLRAKRSSELCFAPGSLISSEIRAERMVLQSRWLGKEILGCQVPCQHLSWELYEKFIWELGLLCLLDWARFAPHFIFLTLPFIWWHLFKKLWSAGSPDQLCMLVMWDS